MDDHDHQSGRFAELQQRWHGRGAPVGAGIALPSLGGFLVLLAQAWSRISCDDPLQRPDARGRGRGGRPRVTPTRRLDPKETTMDLHDSDGIAAAWTVLALHGAAPGPLGCWHPGSCPCRSRRPAASGGASPTKSVPQPPFPRVPGRP
jgi:hypothetical protein